MKQKGSRLTDTENKLVVTSGEGGGRKGNIGVGGGKRVIMELYEIMCVKFLKIIKHYTRQKDNPQNGRKYLQMNQWTKD